MFYSKTGNDSKRRSFYHKSKRAGFSLTELMVVIVIIGLLAGAVAVGARGYLSAGREGVAKTELAAISNALDAYFGINAEYPSTSEGLEILKQSTETMKGGYLKNDLNDPWGQPYQYEVPGPDYEPFEVISAGPDKRFGTDDDISNLNLGSD